MADSLMNELGKAVGRARSDVKYQAIWSGTGADLSTESLRAALHLVNYRPLPVLHVHPSAVLDAERVLRDAMMELHVIGDPRIEDFDEWFVTYYGEAAGSYGA